MTENSRKQRGGERAGQGALASLYHAVGEGGMSAALSHECDHTAIGEQMLVYGVAPITPRDRLAMRANAPLEPRKAQRPANHGLFDIVSRNQIEMF